MKLFDWALRFNGYDINQAMISLDKVMAFDRNDLLEWQQRLAYEAFNHHLTNNLIYQQHVGPYSAASGSSPAWHSIPIIRKEHLQRPFQELISKPFHKGNCFVNNTSGSSGTPFYFAKDKWCHAMSWANTKRLFGQHGIDFNSSLQARFYGIPLTGLKHKKEQLKDFLSGRVRFPVFNLNDAQCAKYLAVFKQKPFEYLNGYTSSLVLFADYLVRQNIVLKSVCPTLKACFTTSEMCSAEDRAIMQEGFGIKVVNEYGASELEIIAFEDPNGQWLINEENLFLEVVDEHGCAVPDGQEGEIVVTSLHNRAFPMVRYALGDRGIVKPNATVGHSRILQQLVGRTNDVALLPSGKKVPGLTFYYVTKALMNEGGMLKEIVIQQTAPSCFLLEYSREEVLTSIEENDVKALFDEYLEPGLTIEFKKVTHVSRTSSGKLKQFSRTF